MDEVKNLLVYVREKSGVASQKMGPQDDVDLNDLINAVMDVSIDMLDAHSPPTKLNES